MKIENSADSAELVRAVCGSWQPRHVATKTEGGLQTVQVKRFLSGDASPSIPSLVRLAEAFGKELHISFRHPAAGDGDDGVKALMNAALAEAGKILELRDALDDATKSADAVAETLQGMGLGW